LTLSAGEWNGHSTQENTTAAISKKFQGCTADQVNYDNGQLK